MVRKLAENISDITADHNSTANSLGHCGQTYLSTRENAVKSLVLLMHCLSRFRHPIKRKILTDFGGSVKDVLTPYRFEYIPS